MSTPSDQPQEQPQEQGTTTTTTTQAAKTTQTQAANKEDHEEIRSYWYPDRTSDMSEVSQGYRKRAGQGIIYLSLLPLVVLALYFFRTNPLTEVIWEAILKEVHRQHDPSVIKLLVYCCSLVALMFLLIMYWMMKRRPVFLIDFAVFQPPDDLKCPREKFVRNTKLTNFFNEESIEFQRKLLVRSGLGDETYFPRGVVSTPPELTMARAREECEMVFTGCLDELFRKTKITPKDIDILIVNCSLFNPTPSISSMIINKYKLRSNTRSYNLSGMGCSAGIIAVDLAKDLLQHVHKNSNCVIFSHENITENWYRGNQKSMLITNTLFRVGGCAMLLSNKLSWRSKAKYKLLTTVRVHRAADNDSYQAIFQMEDAQQFKGVRLSRNLINCVGSALKSNLTILAPQVLPISEQIKFFIIFCLRKLSKSYAKNHPPYTPNFKKAFQHFCIHAGGRGIIDGLQENLSLTDQDVEPSRATLYRYGNTSSSSVWYELNYIERTNRMRHGDKIWQIAFGSGIKCNSAVWIYLG